jgi:hypothetical protein
MRCRVTITSLRAKRYHPGVIRTQISLTEAQMTRLRTESLRRGVSIAALIRDAVDRSLPDEEWEERKAKALSYIGCIDDDATDVAERHDDYLAKIYADW